MERDNQTNRGRGSGITAGEWLRVYISGPITLGDKACNLDQANKAHLELMRRRYAVMNPILTMMIPGAVDIPHQDWLDSDFAWIEHAHAVLRLPGVSDGADKEVAFAQSRGIPVFTSIEQLEDWRMEMLKAADEKDQKDVAQQNERREYDSVEMVKRWIRAVQNTCLSEKWPYVHEDIYSWADEVWKDEGCGPGTAAQSGMKRFPTGAIRSSDAEGVRYDLITPIGLRRLAETYAEGSRKYGDYNWQKGMPASVLLNHAIRHIYLYLEGDGSEDHLAHAAWNLLAVCHFEEAKPEMIDVPAQKEKHD